MTPAPNSATAPTAMAPTSAAPPTTPAVIRPSEINNNFDHVTERERVLTYLYVSCPW